MKNFTLTIHVNVEAETSAEAWGIVGQIANSVEGEHYDHGASVDTDAASVEEG